MPKKDAIQKTQSGIEKREKILKLLREADAPLYEVGNFVVSDHGDIFKITEIKVVRDSKWASDKQDDRRRKYFDNIEIILVEVDYDGNVILDDDGDVRNTDHEKLEDMQRHYPFILQDHPSTLVKSVLSNVLEEEPESIPPELSESTEIATRMDKNHLQAIENSLELKKNAIEAKSRILYGIMESKRSELHGLIVKFQKQIKQIRRVINTIELYLGIEEEIVQIQEGQKAPISDPICIRQQLLYMDEEVGDPEQGGWDFKNIKDFEKWLVVDKKHYEKIIPESKCMLAMRIRRRDKDYGDKFLNAVLNEENMNTFFLLRNGDNIYCIWAKMQVGKRFFPLKDELQDIYEILLTGKNRKGEYIWGSDKERAEDQLFYYKRSFVVMQGLIERTEVFQPLPKYDLNILKPETYGDHIKLISDDEATLPSGRLPYKEWKKKLNKGITRGSRIYIGRTAPDAGGVGRDHSDADPGRILFYSNQVYDAPKPGLYTLEEGEEKRRVTKYKYSKDNGKTFINLTETEEDAWETVHSHISFYDEDDFDKATIAKVKPLVAHHDGYKEVIQKYYYIRYNPGGEARSGWNDWEGHQRKNKISYKINLHDDFIFNYDVLPLEDIDFYLESRVDRPNYLYMIHTLRDLKRFRLEEMEWEKQFAELTKNEIKKQLKLDDKYDADIAIMLQQAIDWWKKKVIWKRPISKDDAKALRMIKQRVIKQLQEKVK